MVLLKTMLKRLGWPVQEMSFGQIAQELHRRWFKASPRLFTHENRLGPASATGIVLALAGERDFKSLCWTPDSPECPKDLALPEEKHLFFRKPPPPPHPHPERRKAPRIPGKDLVCWSTGENDAGTGWLVDCSADGIAFITDTDKAPKAGAALVARIQNRASDLLELGDATVARIEPLTPELSLACLRLEVPCPELISQLLQSG
jgi:hypothetical protein